MDGDNCLGYHSYEKPHLFWMSIISIYLFDHVIIRKFAVFHLPLTVNRVCGIPCYCIYVPLFLTCLGLFVPLLVVYPNISSYFSNIFLNNRGDFLIRLLQLSCLTLVTVIQTSLLFPMRCQASSPNQFCLLLVGVSQASSSS